MVRIHKFGFVIFLFMLGIAPGIFAADGYVDMIKQPPVSGSYDDWLSQEQYWEEGAALPADVNSQENYRIANGYITHTASSGATVLHGNSYTYGIVGGKGGSLNGRANNYVLFPNEGVHLANGQFRQLSSGNRLEIRGKVTIDSPVSAPYEIVSSHVSASGDSFRPSSTLFSGDVICPASNGLALTWVKQNENSGKYAEAGGFWTVTFAGDLSQYAGAITVASNICLDVCTASIGRAAFARHSKLAVSGAMAIVTIENLELTADNAIRLETDVASGSVGQVRITKSLTLPSDRIRLEFDSLYVKGKADYPVLVIDKDAEADVDEDNFELMETNGLESVRASLVKGLNEDGDVVFSLRYDKRLVKLIKSDPSNVNLEYDTYSAFTNSASWSDNDWPTNVDAVYNTDGKVLRMPFSSNGAFTFEGGALEVDGGTFLVRYPVNNFPNLTICNNGIIFGFNRFSQVLNGDLTIRDLGTLRTYGGSVDASDSYYRGFRVNSALHGSGKLKLTGNEGSVNMPTAIVFYPNSSSDFSGKIMLTMLANPKNDYPSLEKGYCEMIADDISVIGTDLSAFAYDALCIEQMCKFSVTRTMTLARSSNRGIYIRGCGRISVPEGASFTVEPTVTYDGRFRKEG